MLAVIIDYSLLYTVKGKIKGKRILPKVLSLGDKNEVSLEIINASSLKLQLNVIDEIPEQFQIRDFEMSLVLSSSEEKKLHYALKPLSRGDYHYGKTHCFTSTFIGFLEQRVSFENDTIVAVYPSIIQMKKYELAAIPKLTAEMGIKKYRRPGQSFEFDHIRNYVKGDDYRKINWKATGRKSQIMVNQFIEEKSQQVISILDNSRTMFMPFDGLSLFDYAVNSSLVISNTALQKFDKAGLISFSDKIDHFIVPQRRNAQINTILKTLYAQEEKAAESNYQLLYSFLQRNVSHRSLLILFTNFVSIYSLKRNLPILRKINKSHVLVVVFFENTEISGYRFKHVESINDIYHQAIAEKFITDKVQMAQTFFTKPKDLSINTINKYLELKTRGFI